MSDVYLSSIEGQPSIISGTLRRNRFGNWTVIADRIDQEQAISGQVVIRWLNQDLRGYVERSEVTQGFAVAVIRGGAGGLVKQLQPKMYDFQVNAGLVANDIANECGERISAASAPVLASALSSWVRRAGSATEQLNALCDAVGAVWRVELDGSILLIRDTYPAIAGWDHDIPEGGWHARYNALRVISTELAAAPGQSYTGDLPGLTGRRIVSVCCSTGDGPECWLHFAPADKLESSEAEPLRQFIRETMRDTNYHVTLSGRAAVQRADGSVDVYPDDKRLPDLTSCIIRAPVPGGKVTVNPGTQVVVLFENADPRQRVIVAYGQGNPSAAMSLVGDSTQADTISIGAVAAMGVLTVTIQGATRDGVALGPMVLVIPGGTVSPPPTPPSLANPLVFTGLGKITGPGSLVIKSS